MTFSSSMKHFPREVNFVIWHKEWIPDLKEFLSIDIIQLHLPPLFLRSTVQRWTRTVLKSISRWSPEKKRTSLRSSDTGYTIWLPLRMYKCIIALFSVLLQNTFVLYIYIIHFFSRQRNNISLCSLCCCPGWWTPHSAHPT